MHTPLVEVSTPILTSASLQYLSGCFPLAFLEGHCPTSSSEEMVVISLHLVPITWVQCPLREWHCLLVLHPKVAGGTPSISFSPLLLQASTFWSPSSFWPQLPSLFSDLHAQRSGLLLPLPSMSGAIAPLCVFAIFHSAALQAFWHHSGKYWRG